MTLNKLNKKVLAVAIGLAVSGSAWSTPVYHPPGPNLTYGDLSNSQSIVSEINNPAAGAAVLQKDGEGGFRFGLISSVGAGGEIGDVGELYNEVDATSTQIQNGFADVVTNNLDPTTLAAEFQAEFDVVNNLLVAVEKDGYAKGFFSAHVPLMPIVITSNALGGSLVLDVNVSAAAQLNFLQDPINFDAVAAQNFINTPVLNTTVAFGDISITSDAVGNLSYSVVNDSSIVVKAAGVAEAALGYSRLIMGGGDNSMFFGVRGKYYQTELFRYVQPFDLNAGAQNTLDTADTTDAVSSTGFGVDVGLLWAMKNMRLGATMVNVNEPSFEYNAITTPTGYTYTDPNIISELNKGATYTMEAQLKFEAAIYNDSRNWVLGASMDANPVEDPFGNEYQWATASVAYASPTFILPGLRVGYRKNLAGSELSYAQLGLTWLFINLDAAYGLEKIVIDGKEQPRSAMANIGIEFSF